MRSKVFIRSVVLLAVIIPLSLVTLGVYAYKVNPDNPFSFVSPLPPLFTGKTQDVLAHADYWTPSDEKPIDSHVPAPDLTAHVALSYDLTTNQMLYARNIRERVPIASLTKIMTALTAIQHGDLNMKLTVSRAAAEVGENSMNLSTGERLKLKDLLYGLILPSGNDAAEVIAQESGMGRENFIFMMNKTAEDLGLVDTHLTNPSGLEGDGDQYSTAYDLLVITRRALSNSIFAEVVSTYEHHIPATSENKEYYLYNDTNLLTTYPGVKGVKTGFTNEAGMCLVTYLDYEGHKIIAVILDSDNRREEMKQLLDYSLQVLEVEPPLHL